ncbi:MAG: S8 family serine peptidase [Prevotella sp.]|jgi:subtilisin family serine protease|nr:S8 family serine peptidase [Prevotella sp.]
MKTHYLFLLIALWAISLTSCRQKDDVAEDDSDNSTVRIILSIGKQYVTDKYFEAPVDSVGDPELRTILSDNNIQGLVALFKNRYDGEGLLKPEIDDDSNEHWIVIHAEGRQRAECLVNSLAKAGAVWSVYIEDLKLISTSLNSYPFNFMDQWHLTRIDGINIAEAWNINKGRNDVIVAVCDGGVDYTHPNLDPGNRSRVIQGYDTGDNDNNPMDDLSKGDFAGHGTHIAGIIGANPTAKNNISGVMQNCKIMPVKMVGSGGIKVPFTNNYIWDFSTTAFPGDVADAIDYAINNGAHIINLSYGFAVPDIPLADILLKVVPLRQAIDRAYYDKNVVVVASMGNDGPNNTRPYFPAMYHGVIAVGNTDNLKKRYQSSSVGSHISVSAPGTNILSTVRGPKDTIGYKTGTSMASPVVAGLAGLIISQSKDRNLNLTNDDVRRIMELTADDVLSESGFGFGFGFDRETGHGIVNAYKALSLIKEPNRVVHGEIKGGTRTKVQTISKWILSGSSPWVAIAGGVYPIVEQYEMKAHVTFPQEFIVPPTVWMRSKESASMSFANPNDGYPFVEITNVTTKGFDVRYAIYFAQYDMQGRSIAKWIPWTEDKVKIAYTAVGVLPPTIETSQTMACNTYTLKDLIQGTTINWQSTSTMTLVSGQGTPTATYQSSSNSYNTVKATITYNGNSYTVESSQVWVGAPATPDIQNSSELDPAYTANTLYNFSVSKNLGDIVNWRVEGNAQLIGKSDGEYYSSLSIKTGKLSLRDEYSIFRIYATSQNKCGASLEVEKEIYFYPIGSGSIQVNLKSATVVSASTFAPVTVKVYVQLQYGYADV